METKKVVSIIIAMVASFLLTGCTEFEASIENKKITKNAINYFIQKYNIKQKDITISHNNLYGEVGTHRLGCINSCGENQLIITYNNKKYTIEYNLSYNEFGDNYQYDEIYNDLQQYLNNLFPFVTKTEITLLEFDVLRTPTKYNHDIENYMKNSIKRKKTGDNESGFTWIKMWIEVSESNQAKKLHDNYSKSIISKMEELQVSYDVDFSKNEKDNRYSTDYYYGYHVSSSMNPSFDFVDKVNNKYKRCNRNTIVFNGNVLNCN